MDSNAPLAGRKVAILPPPPRLTLAAYDVISTQLESLKAGEERKITLQPPPGLSKDRIAECSEQLESMKRTKSKRQRSPSPDDRALPVEKDVLRKVKEKVRETPLLQKKALDVVARMKREIYACMKEPTNKLIVDLYLIAIYGNAAYLLVKLVLMEEKKETDFPCIDAVDINHINQAIKEIFPGHPSKLQMTP